MMEIWKDIPGYAGLYQASNLGRFMSLRWGKIITPTLRKGRNILGLINKQGVNKSFIASRIIAQLFIPNPNQYDLVKCKCKGDEKNLHPDNWRWITYSQRAKESVKPRMVAREKVVCLNCKKVFIARSTDKRKYCSMKCSNSIYKQPSEQGKKNQIESKYKKVIGIKDKKQITFNSMKEAGAYLKINPCIISNAVAGRQPTARGWRFKLAVNTKTKP